MEDWNGLKRGLEVGQGGIVSTTVHLRHYDGWELLAIVKGRMQVAGNVNEYVIYGHLSNTDHPGAAAPTEATVMQPTTEANDGYLATVSHEIRTPITSLMGLLDLLNDTHLAADQVPLVQSMQAVSTNLLTLLTDTIDASRIRAGRFILNYEDVDLRAILERIVSRYQLLYPDVHLSYHYHPALPKLLYGDSHRIEQIVTNVVTNSLKFTPKGEVAIVVEPGANPAEVRILVKDTGIGIDKAKQADLFKPFQQAQPANRATGSGLGLYIARLFTEMHRGHIEVESTPNRGTTMTVTIPLLRKRNASSLHSPVEPLPARASVPKPTQKAELTGATNTPPEVAPDAPQRVLIVDDNPINLLVVQKFLSRWQCRADTAADAKEAIKLLEAHSYGLILMDIRMPQTDGFQLTNTIRSRTDSKANTPIVALTASTESGIKERIKEAAMNGYIFKPFDVQELHRVVAQFIDLPQS